MTTGEKKLYMRKYCLKYRQEHHEELMLKKKLYYEVNNEERRKKHNEYRLNNLGKCYAKVKEWRGKNKLYLRKYFSRYYKLNPQPKRKYEIPIFQAVYENNIKEFETLSCIYCFSSIPFGEDTIDHLTPVSRQGKSNYENLVIACKVCNSMKGTKTYEEFGDYMENVNIIKKEIGNERTISHYSS